MTTTLRYALIAFGTVAATACAPMDDTDEDDTDTDTDVADTDDTDDTTDTDDTEPGTIVDIAAANEDFETLVSALQRTGLDDALAGAGPFTVFAPTDAAFEALGVDLATVSDAELSAILLYHVVSGAVDSGSVPAKADTLSENAYGNGLTLLFDTSSGVVINGDTNVTTADIEASNGIIHVIDDVLFPMDVVDAAVAAGFTELVDAVGAAANLEGGVSVLDALKADDEARTVFAPTNAAFEEIADTVAGLTASQITTVLGYHLILGESPILAGDLSSGDVEMFIGEDATVDVSATPPTIAGQGIIITDIHVTNGVVHVVDGVMIPPSLLP